MPVEKENFVSRWSRRKQQTLEQDHPIEEAVVAEEIPDPQVLREQQLAELNQLTDEDMPALETLDENSDVSGFMSANVSESLRKMALKRLFQGKKFNFRDGLDEYDGDYTSFEKLSSNTVTADMKHMIEVEARKRLAEQEEQRQAEAGELIASDYDEFDEFEDESETDSDIDKELLEHDENSEPDLFADLQGFDTTQAVENELDET